MQQRVKYRNALLTFVVGLFIIATVGFSEDQESPERESQGAALRLEQRYLRELLARGYRASAEVRSYFIQACKDPTTQERAAVLQWDIYRKMFVARPPRNTD